MRRPFAVILILALVVSAVAWPAAPGHATDPLTYTEVGAATWTVTAGSWQNYDIYTAQSVPKGAICEIVVANTAAGSECTGGVRADGSSLNRYFSIHEAESGGVSTVTMLVKSDPTTGYIECYDGADIAFYLMGYYQGVDYYELFDSYALTSATGWYDLGLSAPGGNLVHTVVLENLQQDTNWEQGVRAKGSSYQRSIKLHEAEAGGGSQVLWYVKSDASDVIQYYSNSATSKALYDIGYFGTTVYFVEYFDYSGGEYYVLSNTWTDKDVGAYWAGTDAYVHVFLSYHSDAANEHNVGIRTNGSGQNRYILLQEDEETSGVGYPFYTAAVDPDVNGIIEVGDSDSLSYQEHRDTGYIYASAGTTYNKAASLAVDWSGSASRAWTINKAASLAVDFAGVASRAWVINRAADVAVNFAWEATAFKSIERAAGLVIDIAVDASRSAIFRRSAAVVLDWAGLAARSVTFNRAADVAVSWAGQASRTVEYARAATASFIVELNAGRVATYARQASLDVAGAFSAVVELIHEGIGTVYERGAGLAITFTANGARVVTWARNAAQAFGFNFAGLYGEFGGGGVSQSGAWLLLIVFILIPVGLVLTRRR